MCEHAATASITVVQIYPSTGTMTEVCDDCFQALLPSVQAARTQNFPVCVAGTPCFLCGRTTPCPRLNPDLNLPVCELCLKACLRAEAAIKFEPQYDVVPDAISTDDGRVVLYAGPKESAYNRATLAALRITQILLCCEVLPAYHSADPTIRYLRLPVVDSLAQDIRPFLPFAMSFIAAGAANGGSTLVHCNAGVSRTGAVVVEWIRRREGLLSADDALARARAFRAKLHPNSAFMTQLRESDVNTSATPS